MSRCLGGEVIGGRLSTWETALAGGGITGLNCGELAIVAAYSECVSGPMNPILAFFKK